MRVDFKWAVEILNYPDEKGIPIEYIDTHSLCMGWANALALSGYSDTQIQKMGRWRGATFKEYIQVELACYSKGMSKDMKKQFGFVNISTWAIRDVTNTVSINGYATFKEYIQEEIACYSKGMSKDTKKQFGFLNISTWAIRDMTNTVIINGYNTTAKAA